MKNINHKQIKASNRRSAKYENKKLRSLFMCLLSIFAVVAVSFIFSDFAHSASSCLVAGSNFALMMAIGNIGDVSDQSTSGNNIFYEVYLVDVDEQIDRTKVFPLPNASREVGTIPMLAGQYFIKFVAHSIPKFTGSGEKGDITVTGTSTFEIIMAGVRAKLLDFGEQHVGKRFIIFFRELDSTPFNILGSVDRPVRLKKFESKNDDGGRYVTYSFERSSVIQYHTYTGSMVLQDPATHTAGSTTLAITAGQDQYTIPNGAAATYAIATLSGLTASDKGRIITLYGAGSNFAATVADNAAFTLEDASTWTAKAGSKLVLRVLDPTTLVEVLGSRIQTA